jgi:hypothetical protein
MDGVGVAEGSRSKENNNILSGLMLTSPMRDSEATIVDASAETAKPQPKPAELEGQDAPGEICWSSGNCHLDPF